LPLYLLDGPVIATQVFLAVANGEVRLPCLVADDLIE
jgi:hypothetical protein